MYHTLKRHLVIKTIVVFFGLLQAGFAKNPPAQNEPPASAVYIMNPLNVGSVYYADRTGNNPYTWYSNSPYFAIGQRQFGGSSYTQSEFYRGWVKFDLSSFPSNACIDSIIVAGDCIDMTTSSSQIMMVHRLVADPTGYPTDSALYEAIPAAGKYDSCLDCTQSFGPHSFSLGAQAITDFYSDTTKGWMAIGFESILYYYEQALWQNFKLEVYAHDLSVGASTPATTNANPCAGTSYNVYWASVGGATGYRLYENGNVIYNGTGVQTQLTHSQGTFNYTVAYNTVCGWSAQSSAVTVTVVTYNTTPFPPTASDTLPCVGQSYTIAWDSITGLPGTVSYRLFENGVQIYQGGSLLQKSFTKIQPGTFTYSVQPGNTCGWNPVSGITTVNVIGIPAVPALPIGSPPDPCDADPYAIAWNSIPTANVYRLYEDGFSVYVGVDTSVMFSYPPSVHTYKVSAGNSCGWSAAGATLTLSIEQPPAQPPTPTLSPTNPCENQPYSVSWSAVSGATTYQLYENGIVIYTGTATSFQLSHTAGTFDYYVMAGSSCGAWSGPGGSLQVTIQPLPVAPGIPFAPWTTPCAKDSFPVLWNAVPGMTGYNVYLDEVLALTTPDTSGWLGIGANGNVRCAVTSTNNCGESALSGFVVITVGAPPPAPDTLYSTADTVDINQPYTLQGAKHEFAAGYNLYENGVLVLSGPTTEFKLITSQSIPGDYYYTLSMCSECACSDSVATRLVVVRPPAGCCIGTTGNIDGDPGDNADISDLTYIVSYIFQGGAPPTCWDESDLTLDGATDISDLTFLVDYIFRGGASPPPCP